MRGSVKKDAGSWYYVVDLGRDPATNKRRQERKRGFRTKREAVDALDERLSEVRTGIVAVDQRLTLAQYLASWLTAKEQAGIRATTLRSYRQHVDSYIVPTIGNVRLRDLRATHVEHMLSEIAKPPKKPAKGVAIGKGKRRNPKALSPATQRRVHATLRSALTSAKRKHLVSFNAAADMELPRASRPKVKPWEASDLGAFLDHATKDRLGAFFETIAMTGLRRGEALGIRWPDVDFEKARVTVNQQLVEVDGTGIDCPFCGGEHKQFRFGPCKTASGEARIVDLDSGTLGVLMAQRLRQEQEREQWGDAYNDHQLVFAREDGSPIPPADVTAKFHALTDEAGLRRIRLHDLRHGQASLMLAAGVPIAVVSKRLGHSSISITSDTYSHLLDGVGAAAAEAAAGLVPRAGRDQKRDHESTSHSERDQSVTTEDQKHQTGDPLESESPGQDGAPSRARTEDLRIKSP
ncbi:integrase family protein [Gordonia bronchialis DSM 43247]|uniref:Integrase family protein n=1 Tax=Gordonia bronchialis (strain ATCC 25592 / DSM 43247 / BCRC 13721 / JCM 3198 / KCTC 3076 / NBRC 16047 / NCTC 10667) TaxID=526226 RepID=D0L542_GORB4|nr:integrase family protein [Gordonia bronchialis DSM 43247]